MNTLKFYRSPSSGFGKILSEGKREAPWWHYKIVDPQSEFVNKWNHIFLVTSILALIIDPLYLYLLVVPGKQLCLSLDVRLLVTVTLLRTLVDALFFIHIAMKFKIAFVAPSSRVVGRGDLVWDPVVIAFRYLKSDFIIDIVAALPLPQMVILGVLSTDPTPEGATSSIATGVLLQYFPRLVIILRIHQRIMKTAGVIAKTSWSGSAFTLLFYMLASHAIGAIWYWCYLSRQHECWIHACDMEKHNTNSQPCKPIYFDCSVRSLPDRKAWLKGTWLNDVCDIHDSVNSTNFPYGIYSDAITNKVAQSKFADKYFYCLWWGLKSLSSYGQNLETTSDYVGEILFTMAICIIGLTFFSYLLGKMQNYVQSTTAKIEEWRIKRRDTEGWMRHRQLPEELRERVRRFVQYKWIATRGVDEEFILQSLPLDLRRTIQRHLCLAFVRRVPFFAQMDQQLLDAICERLYSSLNTKDTYLLREGDPVSEMIFIIRGQVESSTTNGGRTGSYNSITLKTGDFCGEELLTWALMPISTLNLPLSTRTVKSLTEVEAFALRAEDLKFVASQFKRLHSKRLQHAFRYYSHQWREWGASYIQVAWRRYWRRKKAIELAIKEGIYDSEDDEYQYGAVEEDSEGGRGGANNNEQASAAADHGWSSSPLLDDASNADNPSTALLGARRLSTRRGLSIRVAGFDPDNSTMKMPKLFKPSDPDFSADH